MECICKKDGNATVVRVAGRLDATSANEFERQCNHWIANSDTYLILDLEPLDYISSAGLRCILATAKKLKAGEGRLALCGLKGLVLEVITISGFASYIPVYESAAEALAQA